MQNISGTLLLRFFLTICLVAVQTLILPALNHNTLRAEKKKIYLQHADTIEGGTTDAGPYRSVVGNVLFQDGTLTLRCDRATDYEQEQKVILSGHIVISDTGYEIYGDSGVYFPDKQTGELTGNVRGRMLDNSLFGKARRTVVNKVTGQIWLYDQAIAWHAEQQISGDVILLHLTEATGIKKRQSIDEVQVHGNAFIASADTLKRSPVAYDQLSGKKMVILLNENSRVRGITVSDQAESLYHLYNEEREPSGINYSSGDQIRMFFTEGVLQRIKVTGSVEGKEYPESFRGNPKINLSKFAWRAKENPFQQQRSLP